MWHSDQSPASELVALVDVNDVLVNVNVVSVDVNVVSVGISADAALVVLSVIGGFSRTDPPAE